MQGGKKRAMHPHNKYAENAPDFNVLAKRYPSFGEYVTYGPNKKPRIDWTDFNATRELTRVLLQQDYGIRWWIPDGQLCPTVPNRANYIHWIADLLAFCPAPWHHGPGSVIRGFDIGTGANCIYPLLGAAIYGWHFLATDVTPIALEWARKNVEDNSQFLNQIEIREAHLEGQDKRVLSLVDKNSSLNYDVKCSNDHRQHCTMSDDNGTCDVTALETNNDVVVDRKEFSERVGAPEIPGEVDMRHATSTLVEDNTGEVDSKHATSTLVNDDKDEVDTEHTTSVLVNDNQGDGGPHKGILVDDNHQGRASGSAPVLLGVMKEGENCDFCMCNPPFFESMDEAGLNPRTACGGTEHEMVYPGGELAFITRIVQDSVQLRNRIQWYTSMVGRKVNIKILTTMLRASGVTILRTTEFVQGRTSRWGIAWSFSPIQKQGASLPSSGLGKTKVSFMLEGIPRMFSAWDVLQALVEHLRFNGAIITVDSNSFSLKGTISADWSDTCAPSLKQGNDIPDEGGHSIASSQSESMLSFQATVFQQAPGNLLVRAFAEKTASPSRTFSILFEQAEVALKKRFSKQGSQI